MKSEFKKWSASEIDFWKTKAGGWKKADVARFGVNWPLMQGWRQRLIKGLDPNKSSNPNPLSRKKQQELTDARFSQTQLLCTNQEPELVIDQRYKDGVLSYELHA